MELMIQALDTGNCIPEIKWNYEEIKQYAIEKAEEYKSIAYTDSDVAAMKKDRADINRFINALDAERKNKKQEYMAPYMVFEKQVKDALLPLREAADVITQGLNEIEQQYRNEKLEKMQVLYQKYAGDLQDLVPFSKTVREEYYKRAFTDKKLEQAYIDLFDKIREDLAALEELPERFRDKAALKYVESFNLSEALREGKRLEEIEKAMEERRKKQEEERQRWEAEEAARKAEAAVQQVEEKSIPSEDVTETKPAEAAMPGRTETQAQEEVMCLDFRVWGTRQQLMALRNYLIENGIQFGKVE